MRPAGWVNLGTCLHVRERCRQVTTASGVTPSRTAIASTPTGHHGSSGLGTPAASGPDTYVVSGRLRTGWHLYGVGIRSRRP
jgi:hypothetical protein